jgi:RNA polymerase primary sigma factor
MDSLSLWKREVDAFPVLTAEQEHKLVVRIAQGDQQAKKELIEAHLRLVSGIAKRYANNEEELKDFIQEGNIGLIRAAEKYAEKYQPGQHYRFSTSAVWRIRYSISRNMHDNKRTIRLPGYLKETIEQLKKVQRQLALHLEHEPSLQELSDGFNALPSPRMIMTPEKVVEILVWSEDVISLELLTENADGDTTTGSGELIENTEVCVPGSESHLSSIHSQIFVQSLLLKSGLNPQERKVIEMRYGLGDSGEAHTLEQCGRELGVSKEYVRQVEVRVLHKLRRAMEKETYTEKLAG